MSIYNEDELVPPAWLNHGFLEKIVKKYENDEDAQLVNFEISPASLKGDHYTSIMFRIKLEYNFTKDGPLMKKSLIVKTAPEEGVKREIAEMSRVFETEIDMYAKTLPKIEEILAKSGDNTRLAPKLIYYELKPNKLLVLEDICVTGYELLHGRHPKLEEIQMVYCKLAKIHAVSHMLGRSECHELLTKYKHGIFSSSLAQNHETISSGIHNFIAMLSVHDEFHEYLPKFKAIQKDLFDDCKRLYRAYEQGAKDEIFVLNHGDFHLKNLMFKFNKKTQLEDLLIVDFQVCIYGPSIIDTVYSVYMMLSPAMRLEQLDELLHYYFEQFIATLKLIKCEGELPKFADFQIGSLRYRNYAIFLFTTFLPLHYDNVSKRPEDLKNESDENSVNNGDALALLFRNPLLIEEVRKALPKLLHCGYLD